MIPTQVHLQGQPSPCQSSPLGPDHRNEWQWHVTLSDIIGHDLANMSWTSVTKNFEIQWKALKMRKEGDNPRYPSHSLLSNGWKLSKTSYNHRLVNA